MQAFFLALVATAAIGWIATGPAWADQMDPHLDPLFDSLKAATTPGEAAPIETRIWDIWMTAKNPTVSELIRLGVTAMDQAQYGFALAAFEKIVRMAPDFAEGWNKRATVFYLVGDY
jgi:cytochrome c-type biogenesis protein CcmH/NrfG